MARFHNKKTQVELLDSIQKDVNALKEILKFAQHDSPVHDSHLVYPDWDIYAAIELIYACSMLHHYLDNKGINIHVFSQDNHNNIYELTYTAKIKKKQGPMISFEPGYRK